MNEPRESFAVNRIKAFKYAFKGAWLLLRDEPSIQVQFSCAILVSALGFYLGISKLEWCLQFLAIGLVIAVEGLNTAIEKLADFIHPDYHKKIGVIKDISAGAVSFAAIVAVLIGFFIYIPYLF